MSYGANMVNGIFSIRIVPPRSTSIVTLLGSRASFLSNIRHDCSHDWIFLTEVFLRRENHRNAWGDPIPDIPKVGLMKCASETARDAAVGKCNQCVIADVVRPRSTGLTYKDGATKLVEGADEILRSRQGIPAVDNKQASIGAALFEAKDNFQNWKCEIVVAAIIEPNVNS